jgi:hypothetical protein
MSPQFPSLTRIALFAAVLAPVLAATGCANMVTTAPPTNSFSSSATISGHLHGGNQPIGGASVKLYAAGNTGYGSAPTLYATTTSADGTGSFSFTKNATNTGPSTPGTPVYGCPSGDDPQIYLIAKGGSTQGTGNGTNSAAVFAVALGKCSALSGTSFINVNEVTSAATMTALQQYFNPTTDSFGFAATAQSTVGFANAVATISNLVNIATGVANATVTPTSTVTGVTMTATPESAKLNTIADILAACVNTTSNTSAACTTLFTNAVPPASAALTSQPTLTFTTATDTLQANYFMLINPTESQDYGATGKLANLYALTSASAPFQPTLSAQPQDWTIGITYSPSGTCTNAAAASFLSSAESIAVDATGNIWFNNGGTTANALSQLSPTGAPINCQFGGIGAGRGLTIDTVGNVWTTSSTAANLTAVYEYTVSGTTLTWPTTTAANGIVADGAGNIFFAPNSSATPFQEYANAATASVPSAAVPVGGNVTSSTGLLYLSVDISGRIWNPTTSSAGVYDLYPGGATPTNGYTLVDVGTTSLTSTSIANGYGSAVDNGGNIFGGNTCCAVTPANTFFKITPSSTPGVATSINSPKFLGGLVAPRSTAIDGAGNVWAGMGYAVVAAVTGPPATPAVFALAEVDNTLTTGLSPNGVTPGTCSSTGSNCPTTGGFQKSALGTVRSLAIDPSGNVWAASNGTVQSIVEIVGQAVPVATPLSLAASSNKLGAKP